MKTNQVENAKLQESIKVLKEEIDGYKADMSESNAKIADLGQVNM